MPHSQAIEQVLALILATLALAGEPVDFTPRLPEGRILSWTHLVNATESSHWGSSEVRAVVLTHLEVERGGRLGEQQLEWVHRVEGVAAELDIGAHTVARWRDDQPSVEAHALQRFEQLSTSIWRTIVSPDGAMEWFQIMRGDGHWDEQVTGPRPPEVLAWAMGLQLGGAAWLPGQTRSREVDLPVWDYDTVPCRLELTLDEASGRRALLSYQLTPDQGAEETLESLAGTGEVLFHVRRGRILEHHHSLEYAYTEGSYRWERTESMSSFLHKVGRQPARRRLQ